MKVIFARSCSLKLKSIIAVLTDLNRAASADLQNELKKCLKRIESYPRVYRAVEHNGETLRVFTVRNYRFWYATDVIKNQIKVVDVMHAHQQLFEQPIHESR